MSDLRVGWPPWADPGKALRGHRRVWSLAWSLRNVEVARALGCFVREVDGHSFAASQLPPGRVAVMFTADWCGYCHRFLPLLRGCEPLLLVDVSQEDEPAWDVHSFDVVPTVIVFEEGREVGRWSGILRQAHADEIRAAMVGN